MSRLRTETVTRHPHREFEFDALGETRRTIFGDDVDVAGALVAEASSSEPGSDTDTAVVATTTLYFRRRRVLSCPWDEWTVRGVRWQQDGEGQVWPLGTSINLTRRQG